MKTLSTCLYVLGVLCLVGLFAGVLVLQRLLLAPIAAASSLLLRLAKWLPRTSSAHWSDRALHLVVGLHALQSSTARASLGAIKPPSWAALSILHVNDSTPEAP